MSRLAKYSWVFVLALISGWSFSDALAREFYSIPVSVKLAFVNISGVEKSLGEQQGVVKESEKGGTSMTLGPHEYALENGSISFRKFYECAEEFKERRPLVRGTFPIQLLKPS